MRKMKRLDVKARDWWNQGLNPITGWNHSLDQITVSRAKKDYEKIRGNEFTKL